MRYQPQTVATGGRASATDADRSEREQVLDRMVVMLLPRVLVGVAFVLACANCAATTTDFHPYSATAVKHAVTEQAVFAYPGDVAKLKAAGGELVGWLTVGGNGFASRDDVRDQALVEAAARGGSHVLIFDESAETSLVQLTNDRAMTTVNGNTATTTFQPGMVAPVTRHNGTFAIVRVPPHAWSELPPQLRPMPNRYALLHMGPDQDKPGSEPTVRPAQEPAAQANANTTPADPPAAEQNWFCQTSGDADVCFRDRAACDASIDNPACERESAAYCFSSDAGSGSVASMRCHATVDGCHIERDAAFASGAHISNECTDSR